MGGPTLKETETERDTEAVASPTNSQQTISDDDEIDYSIKPEYYDSDLDDKDESWVASKRKGSKTDAVLSCPACFTTVCLECQRHEIYLTQYRAMFVVNGERRGRGESLRKLKSKVQRVSRQLDKFAAQFALQRLELLTRKTFIISMMSFQASLESHQNSSPFFQWKMEVIISWNSSVLIYFSVCF